MESPFAALLETGTRLWLDSVDPALVPQHRDWGFTGATSNPVIIAGIVQSGAYGDRLRTLMAEEPDNAVVAWRLTDAIVSEAQEAFHDVWRETSGDDGYVSFEVDPLLEDPEAGYTHAERVQRYIELATYWSQGHDNRMIKIPATEAGIASLTEVVARGVTVNVTLIFTQRQYEQARDAVWQGAQRLGDLSSFKSVYSVFVSRLDAYTAKHVPDLSPAAQGQVGILNAKRIWRSNVDFWKEHPTPLRQEIVFASTGTKRPEDPPWKYVVALAGSDIQTNPPATNEAVAAAGLHFERQVDQMPPVEVIEEIDAKVDMDRLWQVLMEEGIRKFADPQKMLLQEIAKERTRCGV